MSWFDAARKRKKNYVAKNFPLIPLGFVLFCFVHRVSVENFMNYSSPSQTSFPFFTCFDCDCVCVLKTYWHGGGSCCYDNIDIFVFFISNCCHRCFFFWFWLKKTFSDSNTHTHTNTSKNLDWNENQFYINIYWLWTRQKTKQKKTKKFCQKL